VSQPTFITPGPKRSRPPSSGTSTVSGDGGPADDHREAGAIPQHGPPARFFVPETGSAAPANPQAGNAQESPAPHTLRRTYISILLLASRGDVEYVMDQVGHADAETTMRIYSQLLKRAKREHGKAFDSLVADARQTVLGTREGGSGGRFLSGQRGDWAHDWAQKAENR
jgi:hypothetical protein